MLHLGQKCAHFCWEWNIVGYGTGALGDFLIRSLGGHVPYPNYMESHLGFYSSFQISEIISRYREFEFPIYREFEFRISGSMELFSDIGNLISRYQEIIPDIEKWISFSDI